MNSIVLNEMQIELVQRIELYAIQRVSCSFSVGFGIEVDVGCPIVVVLFGIVLLCTICRDYVDKAGM